MHTRTHTLHYIALHYISIRTDIITILFLSRTYFVTYSVIITVFQVLKYYSSYFQANLTCPGFSETFLQFLRMNILQ